MLPSTSSKSKRHSSDNYKNHGQNDVVRGATDNRFEAKIKKDKKFCLMFLKDLVPNSEFADTKLICQNGTIMVHKLLICNISPFLGVLLDDQLPGEMTIIILPDISIEVMRILIQMMYNGEMKASKATLTLVKEAMEMLKWVHIDHLEYNEFEREIEPSPVLTIDISDEMMEIDNLKQNDQQIECEKIAHEISDNKIEEDPTMHEIGIIQPSQSLNYQNDENQMEIAQTLPNNIPKDADISKVEQLILDPVTDFIANTCESNAEERTQEIQRNLPLNPEEEILSIDEDNKNECYKTPTKLEDKRQLEMEEQVAKDIQPNDLPKMNLRSSPNKIHRTSLKHEKMASRKISEDLEEALKAVNRKKATETDSELGVTDSPGRKSLRLAKKIKTYSLPSSTRKSSRNSISNDFCANNINSIPVQDVPLKKKRGRPAKIKPPIIEKSPIKNGQMDLSLLFNNDKDYENESIGLKLSPTKVVNLKNNEQLVITSTSPNENLVSEDGEYIFTNLLGAETQQIELAIPGPSKKKRRPSRKRSITGSHIAETQLIEETQKIRENGVYHSEEECQPPEKKSRKSNSNPIADNSPVFIKQSKLDKFFPLTNGSMKRAASSEWNTMCFCSHCKESKASPNATNDCLITHDKIKCWQCFEDFNVGNELVIHIRDVHKGIVEYKCPWCPDMNPHKALKFFFYHLYHHAPEDISNIPPMPPSADQSV